MIIIIIFFMNSFDFWILQIKKKRLFFFHLYYNFL